MEDQQENLGTLEQLVTELNSSGFALNLSQHQERVQNLRKNFTELQKTIKERYVGEFIIFLVMNGIIVSSSFTRKT